MSDDQPVIKIRLSGTHCCESEEKVAHCERCVAAHGNSSSPSTIAPSPEPSPIVTPRERKTPVALTSCVRIMRLISSNVATRNMERNAGSFEDSTRHESRMSFDEPQELDYSSNGNERDHIEEHQYHGEQVHEENHNHYKQEQYHYDPEPEPVHEEVIQEDHLDDFKRSQVRDEGEQEEKEEKEEIAEEEVALEEEHVNEPIDEKAEENEAREESIDHQENHSVSEAIIEFGDEKEEEAAHHYPQQNYQEHVHISQESEIHEKQNENKTPSPPPSKGKIVNDFKFEESKPAIKEDQGEKDIKRGTVKGLINMWNNPDELTKGQNASNTYKTAYGVAGSEKPRRQCATIGANDRERVVFSNF
ncbi:unnamed protein product, partial [Mesorhabditis belari]|uniref:Uncharacterized protein n=1 Tax=Mesorhabditis belari TaxID=2138241 RepID=A0AAF3ECG5_9BILA